MGLFGGNSVVGIDLGYASIKVVGLKGTKRPVLTGFAEIPVEANSLHKDGEDPTVAIAALKDALANARPHRITGKEAYVSISDSVVFRKIMEIPKGVSEAELPAVVRAAVVEFLPDDIDALELDYQPLATPGAAETQQVIVVAVSKKAVAQYLELCSRAGLQVMAIDPKPSALLRSCIGPKQTEPIILIDIGAELCSLSLCADRAVWVSGTVSMGGNIIKDPATGNLIEAGRDEKLKRLASMIADELDHVIKFYANRASGAGTPPAIKELRLTGGGSMIEGIDQIIANETGMPVALAKPVMSVPDAMDRRFMGALGSALYQTYEML